MSHSQTRTLTRRVLLLLALLFCLVGVTSTPSGVTGPARAAEVLSPPCSMYPDRPDCIPDGPICFPVRCTGEDAMIASRFAWKVATREQDIALAIS